MANHITLAAKSYSKAVGNTLLALPRSWPAIVALPAFWLVHLAIGTLSAPLGMAGGFLRFFVYAGCVGSYLALLERPVLQKRGLKFSDITTSTGHYLGDVISVLFLFWIIDLGVSMLGLRVLRPIVDLAVFLLFNPWPELIYQGRSRSVALLGDALSFMKENWPEWVAVHLIIGGAMAIPLMLTGWTFALAPVHLGLMALFLHVGMLFRGFLFADLSRGSRRTREWRSKF